jgi:hypothetical protein
MSVILAFILVLWAWGWFREFGLRTGHARWSKIDFLAGVYFDVDRYSQCGGNFKTCYQPARGMVGLHNRYYCAYGEGAINKGF